MEEAFAVLKEKGIPEELLYEKKALTLAQVEKVVGKKEFTGDGRRDDCKESGETGTGKGNR